MSYCYLRDSSYMLYCPFMDEFTYSNDYSQTVELVDQANTEIESQNARHEMSSQIDDEDFRLLAIRGLEQEQARSVQSRRDATAHIDYDDIGLRMLAGERAPSGNSNHPCSSHCPKGQDPDSSPTQHSNRSG